MVDWLDWMGVYWGAGADTCKAPWTDRPHQPPTRTLIHITHAQSLPPALVADVVGALRGQANAAFKRRAYGEAVGAFLFGGCDL